MSRINIICIAGMHRSGTSLTASWLERCGLTIHDGAIMKPAQSNPKGHFEDNDFVNLHVSAIKNVVPKSRGWIVERCDPMNFTGKHLRQATSLNEIRSQKYDIWGWKDPRTILFLESWKTIIPEMKVISIWRSCHEVVHSLINRSKYSNNPLVKIGLIKAVNIWLNYNRLLVKYKESHNDDTLLFPLEQIVNRNNTVFSTINDRFQPKLEYISIDEIYEREMMKPIRANIFYRIVFKFMEVSRLEGKLTSLSDI